MSRAHLLPGISASVAKAVISKFWEEWNDVMRSALVTKLGWPEDDNSRMTSDADYTSFTPDSCRSLANCTRNSSLPFDTGERGRGERGDRGPRHVSSESSQRRPRRCTADDLAASQPKTALSNASGRVGGKEDSDGYLWLNVGEEAVAALFVTLILWSVPAALALQSHRKVLKKNATLTNLNGRGFQGEVIARSMPGGRRVDKGGDRGEEGKRAEEGPAAGKRTVKGRAIEGGRAEEEGKAVEEAVPMSSALTVSARPSIQAIEVSFEETTDETGGEKGEKGEKGETEGETKGEGALPLPITSTTGEAIRDAEANVGDSGSTGNADIVAGQEGAGAGKPPRRRCGACSCDLLRHLLGPGYGWGWDTHLPLFCFVVVDVATGWVLFFCMSAIQDVYHTVSWECSLAGGRRTLAVGELVSKTPTFLPPSALYAGSQNCSHLGVRTFQGRGSGGRVLAATCILQVMSIFAFFVAAWTIVGPTTKRKKTPAPGVARRYARINAGMHE